MRGFAIPLFFKCRMSARDGAFHQSGLDFRDGVDEADVRGHVQHLHLRRGEHHRHFRRSGQVRQQFGMSGKFVAGGVQRLLVQWSGTDCSHFAVKRELRGDREILIRGLACLR